MIEILYDIVYIVALVAMLGLAVVTLGICIQLFVKWMTE